jgi:hypothetical protein
VIKDPQQVGVTHLKTITSMHAKWLLVWIDEVTMLDDDNLSRNASELSFIKFL